MSVYVTPDRRPSKGMRSPWAPQHKGSKGKGQGKGGKGGVMSNSDSDPASAGRMSVGSESAKSVSAVAGSPSGWGSPDVDSFGHSCHSPWPTPTWSPRPTYPLGPPNPALGSPLSPSEMTPEWMLRPRQPLGRSIYYECNVMGPVY